jgi:hypothetical protein
MRSRHVGPRPKCWSVGASLSIFFRPQSGAGSCNSAAPYPSMSRVLGTDNIYQSIESPKEQGETGISAASPELEILRWPQHQDALDPLSVEVLEMSDVASYQIIGFAVNRRQQDWLVPIAKT